MEINTNQNAHGDSEITISGFKSNSGPFDIVIKVNQRDGSVEIAGADDVTVEVLGSNPKDVEDNLKFHFRVDGIEPCPEVNVYGCSSAFKRNHCLIFTEENDVPVVKARDGLGSWSKEFLFAQFGQ